jgi:CIC family chloride channel protein
MNRIQDLYRSLLARAKMAEKTFMVTVAIVIGLLGGLGAVGFRYLIQLVQRISWGDWDYSLDLVASRPWWWILAIPAAGGLLVGPLVYFFAREAKGHGVPEVMEAVALRSGAIRPRLVVIKSLASAICIGTGGSVGREGPIVQIGSALGSSIGQVFQVSGRRLRTLVGCGAAAGIAATFNAPVAGALFAVEVILGDFAISQFSPIVISSVIATAVSRHYLGDIPAFIVPEYTLRSAWEFPIYLVLGLVAAAVSLAFVRGLYKLEDLWDAVPVKTWAKATLGGLMVGGIALFLPQVLGVGYEAIDAALSGQMAVTLLGGLILVKILATGITIGSGGSGGVFAPSLFLGAMTGGLVGTAAQRFFPAVTAGPGAYALVGMGAVVAGTTHAPITAILIIFELTSDYKLILPLMGACIISTLVTTGAMRESIYTMKLIRRGIDLHGGREVNVLKSLHVKDVMEPEMMKVPESEPLGRLVEKATQSPSAYVYVTGPEDRLSGVIALPELRKVVGQADALGDLVVAAELARDDVPVVTPGQDLDTVMRIFGGKNREELPVVETVAGRRLTGVLTRRHLMDAYNQELMKRDMVSALGGGLKATTTDEVRMGKGFLMIELDAPGAFLGRSIREIGVQSRFRAQILLLRRPSASGGDGPMELAPDPDTVIQRGDRLVVMGRSEDLKRLRAL